MLLAIWKKDLLANEAIFLLIWGERPSANLGTTSHQPGWEKDLSANLEGNHPSANPIRDMRLHNLYILPI